MARPGLCRLHADEGRTFHGVTFDDWTAPLKLARSFRLVQAGLMPRVTVEGLLCSCWLPHGVHPVQLAVVQAECGTFCAVLSSVHKAVVLMLPPPSTFPAAQSQRSPALWPVSHHQLHHLHTTRRESAGLLRGAEALEALRIQTDVLLQSGSWLGILSNQNPRTEAAEPRFGLTPGAGPSPTH